MSLEEFDDLFILVLIGDSGAGKSCLLNRYAGGAFEDRYISTVGVDFKLRTIEANGRRTKLQIWDTAGQERFRSVSSTYYRGAHGVAIVYDVASAASFANVTRWIGEIDRYGRPGVPKILLGNKSDLSADARETTAGVARKFAEEHHLAFAEVSAKTGDGVDDAFATLAQLAATKVAALPQQVARGTSIAEGMQASGCAC